MNTTIHIPEPCHENWDKMTPREKGRFCNVCEKEVVDFTKSSKEQVVNYLENNEGTCGLFLGTHIGKEKPAVVVYSRSSWFKRMQLSFFVILGFLTLSKNSKAQGQAVMMKGKSKFVEDENTNKSETKLSGSVVQKFYDDKEKGIGNVSIRVFSGGKLIASTQTISNGRFSVKIPKGTAIGKKILVIAMGRDYQGTILEEKVEMTIDKPEMNVKFYAFENYRTAGEPVLNRDEIIPVVKKTPEPIIEENKKTAIDTAEVEIIKINAYPNPSDGIFSIEIGVHYPVNLMVISLEGKVIATKNLVLNKTKIDISGYANGIYFLTATDPKTGSKLATFRMVKSQ